MSPPFVGTAEPQLLAPVSPPNFNTPKELRDWLRNLARQHGISPDSVETIEGDCDKQIATQTADMTSHLRARRILA